MGWIIEFSAGISKGRLIFNIKQPLIQTMSCSYITEPFTLDLYQKYQF